MANKTKAAKGWAMLDGSDLFVRIAVCDSPQFLWRKVCDHYDMSQEALERNGYRCIRVTITPE
jgi:hypothetical protein